MITTKILKLVAEDAKYRQQEELKRKLKTLAVGADKAKWDRLGKLNGI